MPYEEVNRQLSAEDKSALLGALKDNVNVPGLVGDLLKDVLKPALERAVIQTKTPIDDVAMAALYPTLESIALVEIEKRWAAL